jgi:predicted metal-dependent phosphoesterase TrpH
VLRLLLVPHWYYVVLFGHQENALIFDLHSHTTLSDGALTPHELLLRAVEKGVDVLAITDHDTLDAYQEIPLNHDRIKLVPGIELSTQWQTVGIHVLGLNVDINSDAIKTAAQSQSDARLRRAMHIGEKLEKQGITDAFAGAQRLSIGGYIGRPHFARHVINIGKAKSMNAAFKKYLGDGKAGDVKQHWADLAQVIQWIRDANGIAVLAHPLKYKLTRTRLKRLLDGFIDAGGQGMEVVSGLQLQQQTRDMAQLCEQRGLLASCGSDFHMPGKHWAELGAVSPLPANVKPVWERF